MFPGITAPIAAGRPGTLRAIENAVKGDRLVFAVAQRDNTEEPTQDILFTTGVIARIGQIQRGLGGVQLLLQGEQRATALQYQEQDGHLVAVIVPAGSTSTECACGTAPSAAAGCCTNALAEPIVPAASTGNAATLPPA